MYNVSTYPGNLVTIQFKRSDNDTPGPRLEETPQIEDALRHEPKYSIDKIIMRGFGSPTRPLTSGVNEIQFNMRSFNTLEFDISHFDYIPVLFKISSNQ